MTDRIARGLASLGVVAAGAETREVAAQLAIYAELLDEANQRLNLTGAGSLEEIVAGHVLDSAAGYALLRRLDLVGGAAIDVGSGAGLPGIVWAVLGGFERMVCCESTKKKAAFIREVTEALGLANVDVDTRRAEYLGRDPDCRGAFDVATARALAPLPTLVELTAPLARVAGVCLFFKGRAADEELASGEAATVALSITLRERQRYGILDSGRGGDLLLFEKSAPTPDRYPRRVGVPARRPIT